MLNISRTIVTLSLLALFVCPQTTEAAKTFRWKLAKGEKLFAEMSQEMKQTLTMGEKTIEIPNTMKMWMSWVVDEVDADGMIHITQEVTRITMELKLPGGEGEVKYDSDSKDELAVTAQKINEFIKPMIGAKFEQTMDDRGKILDLKVPKEALQGLAGNPIMKQFFSDDSFKDMMSKTSPVLPEEEIEKGYKWTNESSNETVVGVLNVKSDYEYTGEKEKLDRFSAEVKIAYGESTGPLGAKVKITEQDNKGEMVFDNESGYFPESTLSQKINMDIEVGENTFKQQIETSIKMTIRREQ